MDADVLCRRQCGNVTGADRLIIPEAQLQYRWNVAQFSPYVGAGVGLAVERANFGNSWDPTLSVAAGTAVWLTDRVGVNAELRVRGHETRFVGTTAEWGAGLTWRFGAR